MSFYRPHPRVTVAFTQPSLTKQSHKDECDINLILKRFERTGVLEHVRENPARYLDLPSDPDYQEALNTVIAAEQAFAELPSRVRERFNNDPGKFLEFTADPENLDEMVKLGLAKAPPPSPSPAPPERPEEPSTE